MNNRDYQYTMAQDQAEKAVALLQSALDRLPHNGANSIEKALKTRIVTALVGLLGD